MTDKTNLIAAIMGYRRSTSAVRTFRMICKRSFTGSHSPIDILDGRINDHGNLVTTSAALRYNSRLSGFNRRNKYFMQRHPFALGAVYLANF